MSDEPKCEGRCIWAYDLGVNWVGDIIATIDPDCPQHGDEAPPVPTLERQEENDA